MGIMRVGTFFSEWFKEWWALMGCAAFTFLGIYVAWANKSNEWVVTGSACLGMIFFFVASYKAWKRQYDAREKAETELNAEADIHGTISVFPMEVIGSRPQLGFVCDCVNRGRKPCEISRIKFTTVRL